MNRWLAWRFKSGPVVRDISACLVDLLLEEERFEFAWVDKGVWINRSAFQALREKSDLILFHSRPGSSLSSVKTLCLRDRQIRRIGYHEVL